MDENICRVCGTHYPGRKAKCPRCGCPRGGTVPAYLRCTRCDTVLSSRHKTCPGCGQTISPSTARVAFLPPRRPGSGRRAAIAWTVGIVAAVAVLAAEAFIVEGIYANRAYNRALDLWDCGGSIEANRREPDPVYEQPAAPEVPDSLFYDDTDFIHLPDSLGDGPDAPADSLGL